MSESNKPQALKSFGQHFLVNAGVIEKIASQVLSLCESVSTKKILEIGPGQGALTRSLLSKGLFITAIELDPRMVEHLKSEFAEELLTGELKIIQKDALRLVPEEFSTDSKELGFVVCGNLPYNVGSPILFKFLEEFPKALGFCFMLQREVVLKFIAPRNDKETWSMPSVKIENLCKVIDYFWVKAGSFQPPPKVESGVLTYRRKEDSKILVSPFNDPIAYERFSNFLAQAYSQRRKMLRALFPELKDSPFATQRVEELGPKEIFEVSMKVSL